MAAHRVSNETARWLNLIRESPRFVIRESERGPEILEAKQIPDLSGVWWVGGSVTTADGQDFEAVDVVSTDDGGVLIQTYVWGDICQPIASLVGGSGMSSRDVFPFDHRFAVPLERDVFHD